MSGSSSQSSAIQLSGTHSISNSVGSKHKAPLLHPSEYEQWVDRMADFLYAIDPDLWRSVKDGPAVEGVAAALGGTPENIADRTAAENRRIENDRKAMMELRYGLPPSIFIRVQSCKSAREIWLKLKDLYEGTDKRKRGKMQSVITEFTAFTQGEDESLEECYTRYSILLDALAKHNVHKTQVEVNVLFLHALRKEWKPITTMIRIHEQVDDYSLTDLYDLLRNHERDLDMSDVMSGKGKGGGLALAAKEEVNTTEKKEYSGEGMVLHDTDSGNDLCFIVNGQKKYYRQPRHGFTRNEWQSHKDSKNGKNGWDKIREERAREENKPTEEKPSH